MPVMDEEPERDRPEGALETGLWCNRCMLPSGCRWPVVGVDPATGRQFRLTKGAGTVTICVDCGGLLNEEGNVIRG